MGRIDDALRKKEEERAAKEKGEAPPGLKEGLLSYGFPIADFTDAESSLAESYRTLRTNIQRQSRVKSIRSILVASAARGDGRTQTVTNLAVVMSAIEGHKTLLIDADFRNPEIHNIFQLGTGQGLYEYLQGMVGLDGVVYPTRINNLKIVPSGYPLHGSAELFHSPRLGELFETLKPRYDILLFDSPPVIPFTDATLLAAHVDGILLVVKSRETRREVVRRAKDLLNKSEDKFLGVVFNSVEYVIPQSLYRKL